MPTDRDVRRRVAARLEELGAVLPCPRCGTQEFGLLDGYVNLQMQPTVTAVALGGLAMPAVATVCKQCGWVALHALAVLGLLPEGTEPVTGVRADEERG